MSKIDASHTAKPDPLGRRLFFDTETGLYEWEELPDHIERPFANPALTGATEEYHAKKAASGMTIADEKEFEAQAKPVVKTRAAKNAKT